jgi:hypothetical protein
VVRITPFDGICKVFCNLIFFFKLQYSIFYCFSQSSAQANANAFNQQFGPNGFGSSAANAQAQSFNSQSPLGNFGASASNSFSQGFQAGKGGINVSLLIFLII